MKKNTSYILSSSLFFLFFFAIGVYIPILSLYLKEILNFSGKQSGLIMSVVLVSSLISPLIGSLVIDKVISKKWFLIICGLFSSFFLISLYFARSFYLFMILYVLYIIFFSPIIGILTAIALEKMENRDLFGRVRLWGTIGWMAASYFFGFFWIEIFGFEHLGDSFLIGGILYFAFTICALSIPHEKLKVEKTKEKQNIFKLMIPFDAIKHIFGPKLRIVMFLYFITVLIDALYVFGASPFLKQIGIKESHIMPIQTFQQIMEIISLFSLSFLLTKFKNKTVFLTSLVFQFISLAIFYSVGGMSNIFIAVALLFQGVKVGFLIPAIIIYVDTNCDAKMRGSIHQVILLIFGFCNFLGSNISGWLMDFIDSRNGGNNLSTFWLVPLVVTIVGILSCFFFLRNSKTNSQKTVENSDSVTISKNELQLEE